MLRVIGLNVMTGVSFYTVFVFTTTYLATWAHHTLSEVLALPETAPTPLQ